MRPINLKTKIFLDSADPKDTQEIIKLLGFLDGQTTNPTLVVKNPEIQKLLNSRKKIKKEELINFYKKEVVAISSLIPEGSVSIEVGADLSTNAETMYLEAKQMSLWIPNAHIKFPTTKEGLKAAHRTIKEGMRVNMTLCFSQEQAAAVYSATKGAKKGDVFVSPFVGRLDDKSENGMDLIKNILEMYKKGDGHVEVLAASVRGLDHFLYSLKLGVDIITAPSSIYKAWQESGMKIPDESYSYNQGSLSNIPFQDLDLDSDWEKFNINHELTDKGVEKFSSDWNNLIEG